MKVEISYSGTMSLLLILFIGLKLSKIISWSWWWVLSPLWLPWCLFLLAWLIIWVLAKMLGKAI